MITGLLVPSSGTVTLDGIDVVHKPKDALKKIGVVKQTKTTSKLVIFVRGQSNY